MSLLILPNELLFHIAGFLRTQGQVYALARSCRCLYYLLRKYLLQHNVRYSKGSALIWAAERDRRNLVRRLLRLGAAVNTRGEPLRAGTPLHSAAAAGHLGMIKLLIKKGGDPEVCGTKRYKPLLVALLARHEEIAIFLFGKMSGPNCEIAGDAGYTPLHAACLRKLPKSARMFLESGADVNVRTTRGSTPLHLALKYEASDKSDDNIPSCTLELVVLLLDHGSSRDTKADYLGLQHPDPQVRELFQGHKSSSRRNSSSISIGRRWWAEGSSNCALSPTPISMNHAGNQWSAEASGKEESLTTIAGNLLDDDVFPALDPSWSSQVQQPSISLWDVSKVEEIKGNMLVNESTEAVEASSSILPVDPFPKLIGRKSPHPFESVAQLSWRGLRNAKTQGMIEETCTTSQGKIQGSRSHVGQARRKKGWRPLQMN